MEFPAIVVAAYNRPASLRRILASLSKGKYPGQNTPLVISIDQSEVPEVAQIAQGFEWKWGPKKVLAHPVHLGLKKHILSCGDLTQEYGAIILLEDDLVVSRYFYEYAQQALQFYADDAKIGGISLYNYKVTENRFLPFEAVQSEGDTWFMQLPSSWGQAWTTNQWSTFRTWLGEAPVVNEDQLPGYIQQWTASSWKKHFAQYLIERDKYFVFPHLALSTNFADPGATSDIGPLYQVPLLEGEKEWSFSSLPNSSSVYDAWYEMTPACIQRLCLGLSEYDFDVDLLGQKESKSLTKPLVLTTREGIAPYLTFGLKMFPPILNVLHEIEGQEIKLLKTENRSETPQPDHFYYHRTSEVRKQLFDGIFQDWIDEYKQKETYPLISVVIPAEKYSEELIQTIACITEQDYPHIECIVVSNGEKPELRALKNDYSGKLVYLPVTEPQSIWGLLNAGFDAAHGEILSWLLPGSIIVRDSFSWLAKIFSHQEVNWIMGLPWEEKNIASYRWTPERFACATFDSFLELMKGGRTWWSRTLWKKVGGLDALKFGDLAGFDLWSRFFAAGHLYTTDRNFDYLSHPLPTATPSKQQCQKIKSDHGLSCQAGKFALKSLFYPFFKRNIPVFRFIYAEMTHFPPVLKWNAKGEFFYFDKY